MPYISKERRKLVIAPYREFKRLLEELELKGERMTDGDINYIVTMMLRLYARYLGGRYIHHERILGLLECIKQEYYRRVVGPYEDQKIKENGELEQ